MRSRKKIEPIPNEISQKNWAHSQLEPREKPRGSEYYSENEGNPPKRVFPAKMDAVGNGAHSQLDLEKKLSSFPIRSRKKIEPIPNEISQKNGAVPNQNWEKMGPIPN